MRNIHSVVIRLSILLACVAAFNCCSKKAGVEKPEGAITISTVPPEQGQDIVIAYDRTHPKAVFCDVDELWATVTIFSKRKGESYHLKLSRDAKASQKSSAKFQVPEDAEYVQIMVGPPGMLVSEENFSGPVYKDGKPARGALVHSITRAKSLADAQEFFKGDAELYPDDFSRWGALWRGEISSGFPKQRIVHEIDSVRRVIQSRSFASLDDSCDALASLTLGYALAKETGKAVEVLKELNAKLAGRGSSLTRFTNEMLVVTFFDVAGLPMDVKSALDETGKEIIRRICSITVAAKDLQAAKQILMSANETMMKSFDDHHSMNIGSDQPKSQAQSNPIMTVAEMAEQRLMQDDKQFYAEYMNSFPSLLGDALGLLGEYDRAIAVLQQGIRIDGIVAKQNTTYAGEFEHWIPQLQYDIARMLSKKKDMSAALEQYQTVLQNRLDETTQGVMSSSAVAAGRIFLERKLFDSAERYCGYALQIESPFAEKFYADIMKAAKSGHHKIAPMEKLAELYHSTAFERNYPTPAIMLQSTQGPVNLRAGGDTVFFLFFSSSSCSVCRKFIPEIVSELGKSSNRRFKTVVLTSEKPDEARSRYGNVASSPLTGSMQNAFGVRAFPTAFVVRNGKIRDKSEGLSDRSAPGFRYMMERQLK